MILHGDQDDRIHIEEAYALYEALPEDLPKDLIIVEGAGHGLGGISGGVPEQGVRTYGDDMALFLTNKAPACLVVKTSE